MISLGAALLLAAPVTGCTVPPGGHGVPLTQAYVIRIPGDASRRTPMVVSLHAATGSAGVQEDSTRLSRLGKKRGFITVYPQARPSMSNIWEAQPASADVSWVSGLIRFLHASGCSAPERTYVTGMSLGAMVTARLACADPQLMAGVGMVGGALPPEPGCRIPGRLKVMIVHGRDDDVVPFDGSLSPDISAFAGGPKLAEFPGRTRMAMARDWALAKGCPAPRAQLTRTSAVSVLRLSCPGAPVVAVSHARTGHSWNSEVAGVESTSRRLVRFFGLARSR